jgi:predicted nuclease with TOPRIM domain
MLMGAFTNGVVGTVVAGAIFVAGMWTGGADLNRTKEIIDEMVVHVTDMKETIVELQEQGKDKDKEKDKYKSELEKANAELDKANKEAKDLREYAEQKLKEVEAIKGE